MGILEVTQKISESLHSQASSRFLACNQAVFSDACSIDMRFPLYYISMFASIYVLVWISRVRIPTFMS